MTLKLKINIQLKLGIRLKLMPINKSKTKFKKEFIEIKKQIVWKNVVYKILTSFTINCSSLDSPKLSTTKKNHNYKLINLI